jgi:hypothetical protein
MRPPNVRAIRDELNDGGAIRGGGRLIFTRFGLQLDFGVSAQPSTGAR